MYAFENTSRIIYKIGAFMVNLKNPYQYTSDKVGPLYINLRLIQSNPDEWSFIIRHLVNMIDSQIGRDKIHFISGGESADFAFSYPIAFHLKKPHVAIRRAEKEYGLGGRLLGTLKKGQSGAHVADLITYGTSATGWVDVIEYEGGKVSHYIVVFDRLQGGSEALRSRNVILLSLVEMNDRFFQIGIDEGALTQEEYEKGIKNYLADPEAWGMNFLLNNPNYIKNRILVSDGKLFNKGGMNILTRGYPNLKIKFETRVREWLREFGVKEPVEEFGYIP
jgi:orotate phosphoribosyltransferase